MTERWDGLRARDVDRVSVMSLLDDALEDGQLSVAEHESRVESAWSAVRLSDFDELLRDLQRPGAVQSGTSRRTYRTVALMTLVAVLAIVGGAALWSEGSLRNAMRGDGEVGEDIPAAVVDRLVGGRIFTAAGLSEVVREARDRFGTKAIEGVHVLRDMAQVSVYESASPTGSVWYTYSLGGEFHDRQEHGGNALPTTGGRSVDLADLDVERVAGLIASAPKRLRLGAATAARTTLPFVVSIGADNGGEIRMGVNDIGVDSYLVAGLDGRIKGEHPCRVGC